MLNTLAIGSVLCAVLALCSACSSSGNSGRMASTTVTKGLASSAPAETATTNPTPSTGTDALDLSLYAPLTMEAAPSGATVARGTDTLVDITGGDLVISVAKDSRAFDEATQAIANDTVVQFGHALINDGSAMMYAARDENRTDTYLVYVLPPRAPGYACLTRDLTAGTKTIRSYTEEQARRVVAACKSLEVL